MCFNCNVSIVMWWNHNVTLVFPSCLNCNVTTLRLLCWFVCVHTAYCACDYVISLPWSPSLVPEFLDWYMVALRQDNSASIAHALVREGKTVALTVHHHKW